MFQKFEIYYKHKSSQKSGCDGKFIILIRKKVFNDDVTQNPPLVKTPPLWLGALSGFGLSMMICSDVVKSKSDIL